MKVRRTLPQRILAIDPISRGFGFVVLETEPMQLVDWGTVAGQRTAESLGHAIMDLVARLQPTLAVLEDPKSARSKPRRTALNETRDLVTRVLRRHCPLHLVVARMRTGTARALGARTKPQLAERLSARFPELSAKTPPHRQPWQSEDTRTAIFDALALALTAGGDPGR